MIQRGVFKSKDLIKLEPIESGELFTGLIGHILRAKSKGDVETIANLRRSMDELYDFFDPDC